MKILSSMVLSGAERLKSAWHAALVMSLLGAFAAGNANAFGSPGEFKRCAKTSLVEYDGTITDAAINTPELSTLTSLVVTAGLADALADENAFYTVFAPLNSAFDALPDYLVTGLTTSDTMGEYPDLTAVLTYHVADGYVDPRRVLYIREVATLSGQTVFLSRGDDGPMVNQSYAECAGVMTNNGVVWFVDSVLLPQFFAE